MRQPFARSPGSLPVCLCWRARSRRFSRRRPSSRPTLRDPRNILEGNWQSCRERDGQYTERVYDHVVNGVGQFEVHMGPRREFAIFTGSRTSTATTTLRTTC